MSLKPFGIWLSTVYDSQNTDEMTITKLSLEFSGPVQKLKVLCIPLDNVHVARWFPYHLDVFPSFLPEKREQERGSRQQELRGQSLAKGGAAGVGAGRGTAVAASQQPTTTAAKSRSMMQCRL